eukprot:scaffold11781_cov96-Isochrysis_galbana.AAC.1
MTPYRRARTTVSPPPGGAGAGAAGFAALPPPPPAAVRFPASGPPDFAPPSAAGPPQLPPWHPASALAAPLGVAAGVAGLWAAKATRWPARSAASSGSRSPVPATVATAGGVSAYRLKACGKSRNGRGGTADREWAGCARDSGAACVATRPDSMPSHGQT